MEYEIYYFCNVLWVILVFAIILFHFVEADEKWELNSESIDAEGI